MSRSDVDGDALAAELRAMLLAEGIRPRGLPVPADIDLRADRALARVLAAPRRPRRVSSLASLDAHGPGRRWMWAVLAVAAVLAVGFFALVLPGGASPTVEAAAPPLPAFGGVDAGTLPAAGGSATEELRQLAARAMGLPYDASAPIQRVVLDAWFSESGSDGSGPVHTVLRPVLRESYFLADGSQRVIERLQPALDQHGRATSDNPAGEATSDESFDNSDPGPGYVASLPTDPSALAEALEAAQDPAACPSARGGCMLHDIADLQYNYVLPPALLSALWQVVARQPDVTYLGATDDRLGRPAVVLSAPSEDGVSQQLLYADPATGAVLGDELILVRPSPAYSFKPPAVTSFTAVVSAARVGADALPPQS